ncbi:MAG: DNA-3-methyladenine glycosylase [Victivallaceae bacterium]|nr:hypothetical protein [Victivallaceae bacterium]
MKFTISNAEKTDLCRRAPEFTEAVSRIELEEFECNGDLFLALVQSVVYQQLSARVADAIYGRVERLLTAVTPEAIAMADPDGLRACGLSARKAGYLKGIAEAAISGEIDFAKLPGMSDSEAAAELVKLKGVGSWTAEMLLIFSLGRKDVLSCKDLGVRRGLMTLHRLDDLPEAEFEFYRRRYSPHGTLASLYLWRIADGALAD